MMVTNEMNPYLSIIVMLLVGLLIGAWQGFWIAYVRIPPFIVTLAGMLVFRGLSNVVLEGMTLAPMPDNFLALFNNYIPDFFGMEGFNTVSYTHLDVYKRQVESLGEYVVRTKESMEKEQQMMEKELLMKNHLKEAQLKYLQSQINPHFLFNSLNAGVQLAMLEDAEKTCIFVEKMADFFRYNVKTVSYTHLYRVRRQESPQH